MHAQITAKYFWQNKVRLTENILFFWRFSFWRDLSFFPNHCGTCSMLLLARFRIWRFAMCSRPSIFLHDGKQQFNYTSNTTNYNISLIKYHLPYSVIGKMQFSQLMKLLQFLNFFNNVVTKVENLNTVTLVQVLNVLRDIKGSNKQNISLNKHPDQ